MVTTTAIEHQMRTEKHSDFDPMDFDAETSEPGSAWEKVPGSSMYRCVKCKAEEVKISKYCPSCGERMVNFL